MAQVNIYISAMMQVVAENSIDIASSSEGYAACVISSVSHLIKFRTTVSSVTVYADPNDALASAASGTRSSTSSKPYTSSFGGSSILFSSVNLLASSGWQPKSHIRQIHCKHKGVMTDASQSCGPCSVLIWQEKSASTSLLLTPCTANDT